MDITITARHCEVSARAKALVEEKISPLERYNRRISRVEVEVETGRDSHASCFAVSLAVVVRGDTFRATGVANSKVEALDVAIGKIEAQLRRAHDRKRVHHGRHAPASVHEALTQRVVA